jgi:hypothetical protein
MFPVCVCVCVCVFVFLCVFGCLKVCQLAVRHVRGLAVRFSSYKQIILPENSAHFCLCAASEHVRVCVHVPIVKGLGFRVWGVRVCVHVPSITAHVLLMCC